MNKRIQLSNMIILALIVNVFTVSCTKNDSTVESNISVQKMTGAVESEAGEIDESESSSVQKENKVSETNNNQAVETGGTPLEIESDFEIETEDGLVEGGI